MKDSEENDKLAVSPYTAVAKTDCFLMVINKRDLNLVIKHIQKRQRNEEIQMLKKVRQLERVNNKFLNKILDEKKVIEI